MCGCEENPNKPELWLGELGFLFSRLPSVFSCGASAAEQMASANTRTAAVEPGAGTGLALPPAFQERLQLNGLVPLRVTQAMCWLQRSRDPLGVIEESRS